eukprot:scaffold25439_cov109-Skeletonema_marinoi.AAC.1
MLRLCTARTCSSLIGSSTSKALSPPSSSLSFATLRAMSTIKPWPSPMVESHGDYRDEAYLEDHIGGRLYEKQHSLPRLPIPSISETISKFLPTALPLAKSEEEKDTLIKACEEFESQAGELQQRLIERRDGEMKDSSWLQLWWNTLGYLQ